MLMLWEDEPELNVNVLVLLWALAAPASVYGFPQESNETIPVPANATPLGRVSVFVS